MSLVLSTALVNYLMGEGSLRKALEDCVLDIYGGATAPTTADEAPSGTKLCRVTTASGSVSAITEYSGRSTPKAYESTIGAGHAAGNTVKANITVDGVGPTTYTYTILAEDDSDAKVLIKVARMLNDIPQLICLPDIDGTAFYTQSRIDGLDFTLADGTGTYAITPGAAKQAAARANTLYFTKPTAGVITKIGTWSGVNLATGVASYFRFVLPWDTGILSVVDIRVQGVISTSGSDLDMSNTTLTISATTTIDNYTLTLPMAA